MDIDRPTKSEEHPTMKPVELVAKAVQNSSRPNAPVLDLFGGYGTTIIACEQTNRIGFSMELDPKYADVIVNRYVNLTKNTTVMCERGGEKIPYMQLKAENDQANELAAAYAAGAVEREE